MMVERKVGSRREQPSIFVVDGDDAVRNSLSFLLTANGYRPASFASAQEFHEAWSDRGQAVPDCTLVSIYLPDGDGRELCRRITTENPNHPVILMDRYEDRFLAANFDAYGARALLIKPFEPSKLFDLLAKILQDR